MNKSVKSKSVYMALVTIVLLQLFLNVGRELFLSLLPQTRFAEKMLTMCLMIVLTAGLVAWIRIKNYRLFVFPDRFSRRYIIATCAVVVLYIATPANYIEGFPAIMTLVYGSIVTPAFEELVFRGLIWNRFEKAEWDEKHVYVWNVALFMIWHIGYMMPNLADGNWNAVIWKLAAGLGYGAVLGYVRMKSGNCYTSFLVHGVLNLFMI